MTDTCNGALFRHKEKKIMSFEEYWNLSASCLPCFLLREVDTKGNPA